jgi:hypothetical protein
MIRRATGRISSFTDEKGEEQQASKDNLVWKNDDPNAEPEPYEEAPQEAPIKDALDIKIETDISVDLDKDDDNVIAKRC